MMRLRVTTPFSVLIDEEIESLRAEDESGCFGLLPGCADFLTVLVPTTLRWRAGGEPGYCALRSGVLSASGGSRIDVACREGLVGDDLDALSAQVEAMRAAESDLERRERAERTRAHARAARQIMRFLDPRAGDHP